MDTTPRYVNENQTGQFANQRTVTVVGARETCRKPKRAKDYTYHKKKMLMCKQAKKGVPLQAEQADWLEDTDEEVDEQELEAHYSFMAKIKVVLPADSRSDAEPLEKVDSTVIPDSSDKCDGDNQADQNAVKCDDERVALANLIANLKLDTNENKKIQKQLKKAKSSLAQELKECKSTLEETNRTLGESNRTRDRYLGALHDKEVALEKYKIYKDRTIENDTLKGKLKETLGLLAQKEHDIKEEISFVKEKHDELVKQSLLTKSHYEGLVKEKTKNDSFKFVHELKQEMHADLKYVESLEKEIDELEYDKAEFSNMYDLLLQECVSTDVMCSCLHSLSDLDARTELQCLYLHKVKECESGFENRPPMLNKENYVPRSSRLLWYAKSRPNGKLIYNSIMNGPYVRRMIPEPGDAYREVLVNKTFHEQTDVELTEN
ncbi:hypothetical protein Tco_0226363 [Tanacetum coccineum]